MCAAKATVLCMTTNASGHDGLPPATSDGHDGPPPAIPVPVAGRRARRRGAPVTFGLLAMLVVVYVAVFNTGFEELAERGVQSNALVADGQWWRVLTATLLHAGPMHLLFNGYALYLLGAQLERGVGSAAFAALYVASALAGGVAYLLVGPAGVAVGASGAIFGLFGAWFAAAWANRGTSQGRAGLRQFAVLLAINMALPLFIRNIAWQAHVGGLLAGVVVGLAWARQGRTAGRGTNRVVAPAALAGALLLTLLWYTMV